VADRRQVQQRREKPGARVQRQATRRMRRARAMGGQLPGDRGGVACGIAIAGERDTLQPPHTQEGGVGARAVLVVQRR